MPIYRTDFEINASDAQVWAVLVDFDKYPDWNPSLPAISGELREGSTVSLTLGMPGKSPVKVKAKFEEVETNKKLTWRGNVVGGWFFSGYRVFEIVALAEKKVRFTHVEDIGGVLAPIFKIAMGASNIQQSHDEFNQSLKQRVEELAG